MFLDYAENIVETANTRQNLPVFSIGRKNYCDIRWRYTDPRIDEKKKKTNWWEKYVISYVTLLFLFPSWLKASEWRPVVAIF